MKLTHTLSGVDPEIEEGGRHTYRVWIGVAHIAQSCPCACSLVSRPSRVRRLHAVQKKAENEAMYIQHVQSCRGVWGHAPPGKF